MATSIIEKKKYTYADYLKTPDDKRYVRKIETKRSSMIGGSLWHTHY